MGNRFWTFAEMDSFYNEFKPLSAYDMMLRDGHVFTDRKELEEQFDKTAVRT